MANLAHIKDVYEQVNQAKLEYISQQHAWLTQPLYQATEAVKEMPFFDWLNRLEDPLQFK